MNWPITSSGAYTAIFSSGRLTTHKMTVYDIFPCRHRPTLKIYKPVGDRISMPRPNFVAMATRVGPTTFCMVPLNRPSPKTPWYAQTSRAGGRTPRTPRPGGGPRVAQGPHVTYGKIFFSFLMFSKYLWRYSCIMKSTSSVVTYLIFEFSFQHILFTCIRYYVCIMHILYENAQLFSLEY